MPRPFDNPYEEPATEPDLREPCAICGRPALPSSQPRCRRLIGSVRHRCN